MGFSKTMAEHYAKQVNEYMTVNQASQVLAVSINKIHRFIKKGYLSTERVLERNVLIKKEVYQFKEQQHRISLKWMKGDHYCTMRNISRRTLSNWINSGEVESAYKDGFLYVRKDQGHDVPKSHKKK